MRRYDIDSRTQTDLDSRVAKIEKCLAEIVGLLNESVGLQKRFAKALGVRPGAGQEADRPGPNAGA